MQNILTEVLKDIKPSKKEREEFERFVKELLRVAKVLGGDPVIVGSTGKDTWLKGDHDIDLFLMFSKSISREELEKKGLEIGKNIAKKMNGKTVIKYAEHPYVRAFIGSYRVDIVPCYRIRKNEKIISAVDRSPLHLDYVLEHLDPSLKDDVRLLKQFFKSAGVYGSDVKTQGFSGYVCELLVITYGRFVDVIKNMAKWKIPQFIDPENLWNNKIQKSLFKNQPLVLIDPIDKTRNTAAIVSPKNLVKAVDRAKEFLHKPSVNFFKVEKPEPLSRAEINSLKARKTKFMVLTMKLPGLIDDDLYPQVRKLLLRIKNLLEHHEFRVLRTLYFIGKRIYLLYELEIWELPNVEKVVGPPITAKRHVDEFRKKYGRCAQTEGTRWVVDRKREFTSVEKLIKTFINANDLAEKGVPKHLVHVFSKAVVIEHKKFWKLLGENKEFSASIKKSYFP